MSFDDLVEIKKTIDQLKIEILEKQAQLEELEKKLEECNQE